MVAHTFVLRAIDTGEVRGFAALEEQTAYCFVLGRGQRLPQRRFAKEEQWAAVIAELANGLLSGALPSTSALSVLLRGHHGHSEVVDYTGVVELELERQGPEQAMTRHLQAVSAGARRSP